MSVGATLWGLFAEAAARVPGAPALEGPDGTALAYAALAAGAEAAAAALRTQGVLPGDRVVVALPPSLDALLVLLAGARLGAVIVPLHPQQPPGAVAAAARTLDARIVVTHEQSGTRAPVPDTPPTRAPAALLAAPRVVAPPLPSPRVDADAPAAIFWTSGSTGLPKGVVHRHAALVRCARDAATYLRYRPDERVLALLPWSFHYGFHQLWSTFASGGTVVLAGAHLPGDLPALLADRRVTGLAGVPTTWLRLLDGGALPPLPALRFITNAGGGLAPDACLRLRDALPGVRVHLLYGLTEALRTTHLPPEQLAAFPGALGRPVPGVEVLIVDRDRRCGPDEVGELVHRGPTVALGYFGRTGAPTFRPAPELGLPGDEIVCFSGDLVRRDAQGVLWYVGRRDGLIKTAGFRVGPAEVEAAALASELVVTATAFGAPDPALGQTVELVVTTAGDAPLDTAALLRHCRATLPAYMVPRRVHHWRGPLPLTPTGKPARDALVRACLTGDLPSPEPP